MGKVQKEWARAKRRELLAILGACCKACGRTVRLEFDCIDPKGDEHHRKDTSTRMCFYRKQHRLGNIQVLCKKCHNKKSLGEREADPF